MEIYAFCYIKLLLSDKTGASDFQEFISSQTLVLHI